MYTDIDVLGTSDKIQKRYCRKF